MADDSIKRARKVLIAMIVDPTVLGKIASRWTETKNKNEGLFADDWCNLIGNWCCTFYTKYGKAPGKNIENTFADWSEGNPDKTKVQLIEKFLASLSGEYTKLQKDLNPKYTIDQAINYFNKVRLEKHIAMLEGALDQNKVDKAFQTASKFGKIDLGVQRMINPFKDKSIIAETFSESVEPLVKYQGALGNFYEDAFARDTLVSFMGPEKRGKTFWLIDVVWRAILQQRRVAMFEVGDMSQNQIMRRLIARAAKRPYKQTKKPILIPTDIEPTDSGLPNVTYEEKDFTQQISFQNSMQAFSRISKMYGNNLFRFGCWPNNTMSVAGIQSELDLLERTGWVPDVVVIDYADILAAMPGYTAGSQDDIDATWKALKSITQQLHCCVVTATQSDAASYYAEILDKSHFSRDKRKFAHVNAMIGINQTNDEKAKGLYRLNHLVMRESEYDEKLCVFTAGCLAIANPAILSVFDRREKRRKMKVD